MSPVGPSIQYDEVEKVHGVDTNAPTCGSSVVRRRGASSVAADDDGGGLAAGPAAHATTRRSKAERMGDITCFGP
jgi:hypothetical protein